MTLSGSFRFLVDIWEVVSRPSMAFFNRAQVQSVSNAVVETMSLELMFFLFSMVLRNCFGGLDMPLGAALVSFGDQLLSFPETFVRLSYSSWHC